MPTGRLLLVKPDGTVVERPRESRNKLQIADEVVAHVKQLQRVYQITPSDEALTGLIRDVKGTLDSQTDGDGTVFGAAEQVVIPEGGTF